MPYWAIIDMDGIRHAGKPLTLPRNRDGNVKGKPAEPQMTRAVVRLCSSLLACTACDRLRFLKRYLTANGRTAARWKEEWRRLHEEVCRKLQDKEVRRRWKLAHYGRE